MAYVFDGVLPHRAVHVDGRGQLGVVLCDICSGWWERCDYGLLEGLKAVCLFEFPPGALNELPPCDQCAGRIIAGPLVRELLYECFDVVVVICG